MEKPRVEPRTAGAADPSGARIGEAEVVFRVGPRTTPLYERGKLDTGNRVQGPALVLQMDSTIVVPPGWGGPVDPFGNLVLEPV